MNRIGKQAMRAACKGKRAGRGPEAEFVEEGSGKKVDGGSENQGRDSGLTAQAIKIHSGF